MRTSGPQESHLQRTFGVIVKTMLPFILMVWILALSIATKGQAQTFTVLHRFKGNTVDGLRPYDALSLDRAGNIYGATYGGYNGVTNGFGTVFRMSNKGRETVLYTFTGGTDGAYPYAGVVRDIKGNLYGTTYQGGDLSCTINSSFGCGTVFKVDPTGKETVIYAFKDGADGAEPLGDLLMDKAGNLYGTTASGGDLNHCPPYGCGTVFQIDPTGKETTLYSFTGGADGAAPSAGLVQDKKGNFYGTATGGGAHSGYGVVFELTTTGKEIVWHTFRGTDDGDTPESTLVRDAAGNLYGTSSGGRGRGAVVFKVRPSHAFTPLYKFKDTGDGDLPSGRLVMDSAGNLYGTTELGASGGGTVFKIDTTGMKTVLHSFTNQKDGGHPRGGLVADKAGNLYGTASTGGQFNQCPGGCGVVFKIAP